MCLSEGPLTEQTGKETQGPRHLLGFESLLLPFSFYFIKNYCRVVLSFLYMYSLYGILTYVQIDETTIRTPNSPTTQTHLCVLPWSSDFEGMPECGRDLGSL